MFMAAIETTVVATAMPTIVGLLGGLDLYGWVGASYLLASTVGVPLYGRLADMYGRKPVILSGIACFLVASVACGAATSIELLIAARVLQGLGAGAIQPISMTIVGDLFRIEERAKIQGLIGAVWAFAAVSGPALGGIIVTNFGWRWIFWFNIPFGVAAAILLSRAYREPSHHQVRGKLDWPGAMALAAGTALLLVGSGGTLPAYFLPLGAAAVIAFIVIERRATDPILDLQLMARRHIAVAMMSAVLLGAVLMGLVNYLPLYVQGVLGETPTMAGTAITPALVGWPIAATLTSRLLLRTGFRWPVILGSLLASLAGMAIALEIGAGAGLWAIYGAMFVLGIGMGLNTTSLIIAVQSSVPWRQRGAVTATTMFSRMLGNSIGVAGLGALLAMRLGGQLPPERVKALLTPHASPSDLVDPALARILEGALAPLFWILAASAAINLMVVLFYPRHVALADDHTPSPPERPIGEATRMQAALESVMAESI